MMRPYRNILPSELSSHGALCEWESSRLLVSPPPFQVLWVHSKHQKLHSDDASIRTVTVLGIEGESVRTDFGSFSLHTGKSLRDGRGIETPGDCCGQLYLLKDSHALSR